MTAAELKLTIDTALDQIVLLEEGDPRIERNKRIVLDGFAKLCELKEARAND